MKASIDVKQIAPRMGGWWGKTEKGGGHAILVRCSDQGFKRVTKRRSRPEGEDVGGWGKLRGRRQELKKKVKLKPGLCRVGAVQANQGEGWKHGHTGFDIKTTGGQTTRSRGERSLWATNGGKKASLITHFSLKRVLGEKNGCWVGGLCGKKAEKESRTYLAVPRKRTGGGGNGAPLRKGGGSHLGQKTVG